uniref:COBRA-like protein n=1 Tax=Macrostomum lignano TaxID=282301 RepID=A0A1I8FD12_9PLAT
YQPGSNPLNLVPQAGFFEAVKLSGGASEVSAQPQALCQVVTLATLNWCPLRLTSPYTVMGNWNFCCCPALTKADAVLSKPKASSCGCFRLATSMPFTNDLAQTKKIKGGSFVYGYDAWVKLTLTLQSGKYNGKDWKNQTVANSETLPGSTPSTGFAENRLRDVCQPTFSSQH